MGSSQRPVGLLATSQDVNVELITKVFDLDSFHDVIVHSDEKASNRPVLMLVVGYPHLVQAADIALLADDMIFSFVDAEEVLSRASNVEQLSESEVLSLVQAEINGKLSYAEKHDHRLLRTLLINFPRTEAEAHALTESSLVADCIIELVPGTEDVEIEDDDVADDVLDAIEHLRKVYLNSSEFHEDTRGNAHSYSKGKLSWRRVVVDDSDADVADMLYKELYNAADSLVQHNDREPRVMGEDSETHGANAFVVTLFCIEEEYSSRAIDLLRMAFEEHPHLGYCLYMQSNKSALSHLTKWMTAVRLLTGVSFDQTLFLVHRDVMSAGQHLCLVRLTTQLRSEAEDFLRTSDSDADDVCRAAAHSLRDSDVDLKDNPAEVTFLVTLDREIVGCIVLSRRLTTSDDVTWIRTHYEVDELIAFDRHRGRSQAVITHWVLSPVYSRWTRFVMRELMRLYFKTLLYFQSSKKMNPPLELTMEMVACRPRRLMQLKPSDSMSSDIRPTPHADGHESPLFFMTKRTLSDPKTLVGTRVVVVGGGSATFSFLETLCFVHHLHLSNIVLVMDRAPQPWTSHEDDASSENSRSKTKMNDLSSCLTPTVEDEPSLQELYALGLANRVTLALGHLTDIDRANRAIVVSDDVVIEYDILVLCSGMQDSTHLKIDSFSKLHPRQCSDFGFFCLGSAVTEYLALQWVLNRYRIDPLTSMIVIVYGGGLDSMCAVGRLLERGVDPRRIHWVVPRESVAELGHDSIDEAAGIALSNCKIKVSYSCEILSVGRSEAGFVRSVTIRKVRKFDEEKVGAEAEQLEGGGESKGQYNGRNTTDDENDVFVLECGALLTCVHMNCDMDVFTAINECGLVFDGGVVVNSDFRTVDPLIYAMGNFTRFSRMHKDAVPHAKYNPRELGSFVATNLLKTQLDPSTAGPLGGFIKMRDPLSTPSALRPFRYESDGPSEAVEEKLPQLLLPKTISAVFPGGLSYVRISVPVSGRDRVALVTGDSSTDRVCVVQVSRLKLLSNFVLLIS